MRREQEAKLSDELVSCIQDTATRLNIEFSNEHRTAVEKAIRSGFNENGYVEMKEGLGETKKGFTEMEETEFQEMISGMLTDYDD